MNIIEVKDITKHYSLGTQIVEALRGVSFNIEQGEFLAIMGPSGSGKSTLMNIIGCLDSPTNGKYYLNQQEVSTLEGDELAGIRNKEIGFVFQNFHLLARNSALDNVMLPLKYAGIDKLNQIKIAKNALIQVGLESRMDHQPSELSGGQQQRVAIARALVNNPSILFADEPTGNLDSQTGHDVMQLFHNLHQQGQTIILITHENDIAAEAQRTIFIKDGLIESDTRKEKL
ncbi:MAG: ABC transporter ATP-binding protein [SAR86 cluster bacterium]|nr:ABC transporter ATP-binding protein [SAR86 cluster bacterium]